MELVSEMRENYPNLNLPKVKQLVNSFFYTKLMQGTQAQGGYCYGNVKTWTRKFKLFEFDKLLVPISKNNNHWVTQQPP